MWSNYVPNLIEIDQSADELLTIWPIFSRGSEFSKSTHQRVGQTASDLGSTEFCHRWATYDTMVSYMRCFVSKWRPLKEEWCRRSSQISHFLTPPPYKNYGVCGENAEWEDRVYSTTEPVVYTAKNRRRIRVGNSVLSRISYQGGVTKNQGVPSLPFPPLSLLPSLPPFPLSLSQSLPLPFLTLSPLLPLTFLFKTMFNHSYYCHVTVKYDADISCTVCRHQKQMTRILHAAVHQFCA